MKKLFIITFFFVVSVTNAQTSQVGWLSKFGIAVGFTPSWAVPDFSNLNQSIKDFGVPEFSKSGFPLYGGSGYAYLMIVDNLRLGGTGYGGSTVSSATVNGFQREARFSLGGGALTVEYTMPFIKKIAVSAGTMIGWGSMDIELSQNSGELSWNNSWLQFMDSQKSSNTIYKKMTNNFFYLTPTINTDIPLSRFIALRAGAGYQLEISSSWEFDNQKPLTDVPEQINSNHFFVQLGLFIGFFGF